MESKYPGPAPPVLLQETKHLASELEMYLYNIPEDRPLLIFLDSLDQLNDLDGGRQLDWLPKVIPATVKMFLSTLPDDKYGCLSRCRVSLRLKKT